MRDQAMPIESGAAATTEDLVSDEQLVARVRKGDPEAGRVIFQRHHKPLLAFCRHLLGNRLEAEQVVRHSCGQALGTLRRHDRPVELHVWLYAVARSRCLAVLARRGDRPGKTDHEGLADAVAARPDLKALLAELAEMPDEQRAVVVLAELGEHDMEEIGAIVGLLSEKVESLLAAGREALAGLPATGDWACGQVRGLLALDHTVEMRREGLRRHVDDCATCGEFRARLAKRRADVAIVLPVEPSRDLNPPGAMTPGSSLDAAPPVAAGQPAAVQMRPVRFPRARRILARAAAIGMVAAGVGLGVGTVMAEMDRGGGAAGGSGPGASSSSSKSSSSSGPSAPSSGKPSRGRPTDTPNSKPVSAVGSDSGETAAPKAGSGGSGAARGKVALAARARRGGGSFAGHVARASRRVRRG
jgi:DNA-directed RNA polymerase specialized sigma24 family protein